ncbi:hypothetical protein N7E81_15845 [Reichenbachiella carrageenanivorans]|uniref:Cytochrome b561 n=1 Tax=Reichenbachiella carrageenanivorans TaxID=2979869 RepID=A0ABY6CZI0_9BACT|nr:hypothetical protein [Reichenbachiella carrageenanivorans]UXX78829.1 hypothetical protein N7E81_15845 [Reichenbachiella carrageenanivorans]
MYTIILYTHSWLRWVVLILALVNIYKSFVGFRGALPYGKSEKSLAASFVGTLHLTFVLGLILYFISPYAYQAFGGSESVMKNPTLRFWAVEHAFVMILAIAAASIGNAKAKRAATDPEKFKAQLIFFSIALILILSRIPWGEAGRLFRF